MPLPSPTHLIIMPTYNTGPRLLQTVREALEVWSPIWVVVDGSTDGSDLPLDALARDTPHLRILRLASNQGKGAAVLHAATAAAAAGFSHALTMDADGQHPATAVAGFMKTSLATPRALVLGVPQFDDNAPAIRVNGRKICNFWTNFETLWSGIGDSLFGMRVYPLADLVATMTPRRFGRGFDFDPELAVRLCWRGLPLLNIPCPVRYLSVAEGGVSQFRYLRDNTLLTWMHLRLMIEFLIRLPVLAVLAVRRLAGREKFGDDKGRKKG